MMASLTYDYGTGTTTGKWSTGAINYGLNCYMEVESNSTASLCNWPGTGDEYTVEVKTIKFATLNSSNSYYQILPAAKSIQYKKGIYDLTWPTCTDAYAWCEYGWPCAAPVVKTPQEQLREILQRRHAPLFIPSRKPIAATTDTREERARETLRLCLGEDRFRSFIKNGFVTVRAKSGLVYQIFPGHGITAVYKNGQMVERLCVVFRGNFPPADSLIMRFLLILNDEDEFRSHAIKHGVTQAPIPKQPDVRSLPEIYRALKVA